MPPEERPRPDDHQRIAPVKEPRECGQHDPASRRNPTRPGLSFLKQRKLLAAGPQPSDEVLNLLRNLQLNGATAAVSIGPEGPIGFLFMG
jgi:hypothetical protein